MIYIKRALLVLLMIFSIVILPWEMCIRYIITGKDSYNKTLAYKLLNKIC